jgi:serine/threonine-protein phosphatase 2A regulatory subunit B'
MSFVYGMPCFYVVLSRTIHGLIYNALKLFMEMNQRLFDECTQMYKTQKQLEKENMKRREEAWGKISQLAHNNPLHAMYAKQNADAPIVSSTNFVVDELMEIDMDKLKAEVKEVPRKGSIEKTQLNRRSELPHDGSTLRALEAHKRADTFLTVAAKESG